MRKMPHVFLTEDGKASTTLSQKWVNDPGVTYSRKWDGTACYWDGSRLYARYESKKGRKLPGMFPCTQGGGTSDRPMFWVPVDENRDLYKQHLKVDTSGLSPGTYELCGPPINGNPEKIESLVLIRHGVPSYPVGRKIDMEVAYQMLENNQWEGLVFLHPSGDMAKLTRKSVGLPWPVGK